MTVTAAIRNFFHQAVEYGRDVMTALREPQAMTPAERHRDEFKIATGAAVTGASTVELNPIGAAAGMEPMWDGLSDLRKAGHTWRTAHPAPQAR